MNKRIISFIIVLTMVLSLCACGTTTGGVDWQAQIDELNKKIETQNGKITELESGNAEQLKRIAELENYNAEQIKKINKLEKENARKTELITDLEEDLENLMGPGLEIGLRRFGYESANPIDDEPSVPVRVAGKTRTTTFDIDKVKIIFYYGSNTAGVGVIDPFVVGRIEACSGSGREFSRKKYGDIILLKEIDNFDSYDYYVCESPSKFSDFKTYEIFKMPKEFFVEEKGWLYIGLSQNHVDGNGKIVGCSGTDAIYLYYKITEGKVTLSTTWFED